MKVRRQMSCDVVYDFKLIVLLYFYLQTHLKLLWGLNAIAVADYWTVELLSIKELVQHTEKIIVYVK